MHENIVQNPGLGCGTSTSSISNLALEISSILLQRHIGVFGACITYCIYSTLLNTRSWKKNMISNQNLYDTNILSYFFSSYKWVTLNLCPFNWTTVVAKTCGSVELYLFLRQCHIFSFQSSTLHVFNSSPVIPDGICQPSSTFFPPKGLLFSVHIGLP